MTMSVFVGPNAVNQFAPKRVAVKRRKGFLKHIKWFWLRMARHLRSAAARRRSVGFSARP